MVGGGGADLKSVMDRMGYSGIQTTQKYLHSLPDADDRALAVFTPSAPEGPGRLRGEPGQQTTSAGP